MADKETKLSIIISTVDKATAKIKAINERLDAATKPIRDFRKELGELGEKSGLNTVVEGFKGVGEAVKETLFKFVEMAAIIGEATHLVLELVEHFEELGKTAERIGVSVDFLAGMRDAAERSGASIESLDSGLQAFSQSLGQARAGTGRMKAFLDKVSPALERQLVAAKSNEEAFRLLADAMAKLKDPAKRAALAQKTVGDATLAPLFMRGAAGIKELQDHYLQLAGSQKGAAEAAGETHEAMLDLKASTDGVKAALVEGLAPALTVIIKQITEWLQGHRADIKEWAASLGKKLPDAFRAVAGAIGDAIDAVKPFVDSGWKLKAIALALAAVIVGPLITSIVSLGIAILSTPVGWIMAAIALIAGGVYEIIKHWDGIKEFFGNLWDTVKSAFSAFFDWVSDLFLTYTPLGQVIKNWGAIKDFFVELWDGITSVFQRAWDFIMGIVDKIVGAVDKVKNAASRVINFINPFHHDATGPAVPDVFAKSIENAARVTHQQQSSARVSVDFANAPRGMRVNADARNTADVDYSVGYQMGFL